MITEYQTKEPITILNAERYGYYKECERKANITDEQIRKGAIEMFKGWSKKTDFKVEISMLTLRKTFINSRKTSFFCEWYRDKCVSNRELEDIGFVFEQSINEAVNRFVSEAYKEHRQELENEFNTKMSKRHKSYNKMKKLFVYSLCATAVLLIAVIIMTIKLI